MWDLIVSVPDHCLSFYFTRPKSRKVDGNYLYYFHVEVLDLYLLQQHFSHLL